MRYARNLGRGSLARLAGVSRPVDTTRTTDERESLASLDGENLRPSGEYRRTRAISCIVSVAQRGARARPNTRVGSTGTRTISLSQRLNCIKQLPSSGPQNGVMPARLTPAIADSMSESVHVHLACPPFSAAKRSPGIGRMEHEVVVSLGREDDCCDKPPGAEQERSLLRHQQIA